MCLYCSVGFIENCATQEALCDFSVLSCSLLKGNQRMHKLHCTFSSLTFFTKLGLRKKHCDVSCLEVVTNLKN
jgi:hypothetical protein